MHTGTQHLTMAGPGAALRGGLGQNTQAPLPSAPPAEDHSGKGSATGQRQESSAVLQCYKSKSEEKKMETRSL